MSEKRTSGAALRKLRARVFSLYGYECWLCGGDGADTIDHLLPVMHGGTDEIDNLRPAHGRKSKNCVGNFSRKRPTNPGAAFRTQTINGVTYGDGYIEKSNNGLTTRIYPDIAGLSLSDPLVQQFISSY